MRIKLIAIIFLTMLVTMIPCGRVMAWEAWPYKTIWSEQGTNTYIYDAYIGDIYQGQLFFPTSGVVDYKAGTITNTRIRGISFTKANNVRVIANQTGQYPSTVFDWGTTNGTIIMNSMTPQTSFSEYFDSSCLESCDYVQEYKYSFKIKDLNGDGTSDLIFNPNGGWAPLGLYIVGLCTETTGVTILWDPPSFSEGNTQAGAARANTEEILRRLTTLETKVNTLSTSSAPSADTIAQAVVDKQIIKDINTHTYNLTTSKSAVDYAKIAADNSSYNNGSVTYSAACWAYLAEYYAYWAQYYANNGTNILNGTTYSGKSLGTTYDQAKAAADKTIPTTSIDTTAIATAVADTQRIKDIDTNAWNTYNYVKSKAIRVINGVDFTEIVYTKDSAGSTVTGQTSDGAVIATDAGAGYTKLKGKLTGTGEQIVNIRNGGSLVRSFMFNIVPEPSFVTTATVNFAE